MWHRSWFNSGFFRLMLAMILSCYLTACSADHVEFNDAQSNPEMINKIDKHYQAWRNVPYLYGGYSQNGSDCSGLVMNFYQIYLQRSLPRMTTAQAKVGENVSKLVAGDLVFFETGSGKNGLHVGIYYQNGQFLHMSTSKGVRYSNMKDKYWQSNYLYAKRVVDVN